MTMPKWHETMRPILVALEKADGYLKGTDLINIVAEDFNLTDSEKAERLNSGQLRLYNRTYWGITDLEKAGLLEYGNARSTYRITPAGRDFLKTHEGGISAKLLYDCCPAFKKWKDDYRKARKEKPANADVQSPMELEPSSPQEVMDASYAEIRDALANDLLTAIMDKDPFFFEHMVGKVLIAMGYGETTESQAFVTQKTADEGIDGMVKEDRLGFDAIYYQAKRWDPERTVSRPDIQAFVGALSGKGATKGLFITTAHFSEGAKSYAERLHGQKVVLVDGKALANLMIDYGVGVSTRTVYEIKAIDTDFFDEA